MQRDGVRFKWNYLLKSKTLLFAVVALTIAIAVVIFRPTDGYLNRMAFLLVGILIGRLARDAHWLKDVEDGFSFLVKVLDWERVERLAATEDERSANDDTLANP